MEKPTRLQDLISDEVQEVKDCLEEKIAAMKQYRNLLIKESRVVQDTYAKEIKDLNLQFEKNFAEVIAYRDQLVDEKTGLDKYEQNKKQDDSFFQMEDDSEIVVGESSSILTTLVDNKLQALNAQLREAMLAVNQKKVALNKEKKALQEPLTAEIQLIDEKIQAELNKLTEEIQKLTAIKCDLVQTIEARFLCGRKMDAASINDVGLTASQFELFQKKKERIINNIQQIEVNNPTDQNSSFPNQLTEEPLDEKQTEDGSNSALCQQFQAIYQDVQQTFSSLPASSSSWPKIISLSAYRRCLKNIESSELHWLIITEEKAFDGDCEEWKDLLDKMTLLPKFVRNLEHQVKPLFFSQSKAVISRFYWNKLLAYQKLSNALDFFVSVL